MKVRKIEGARWYAVTVDGHGWEDVFEGRADIEIHFDAVKHGNSKWDAWEVSYRNGSQREDDIWFKIASFDKLANAKRYLVALAEAQKESAEIPKAEDFEDLAYNTFGFEKDDRWQLIAKK